MRFTNNYNDILACGVEYTAKDARFHVPQNFRDDPARVRAQDRQTTSLKNGTIRLHRLVGSVEVYFIVRKLLRETAEIPLYSPGYRTQDYIIVPDAYIFYI